MKEFFAYCILFFVLLLIICLPISVIESWWGRSFRKSITRMIVIALAGVLFCGLYAITPADAAGEGNMDGGGGNMGDGAADNYWNPGMDGVRVSVVHKEAHAVIGTPIDLTNKRPNVYYHFGKVCKLEVKGRIQEHEQAHGDSKFVTCELVCESIWFLPSGKKREDPSDLSLPERTDAEPELPL